MTTAVFLAPLSVAGGPFFIPGTVSPASGGQLFSYITGTSTKLNTYTTSSGAVANTNPILLDSGGFITGSGEVWLIQSSTYRFILAPSTDTDPPASPYWTRDSIAGINDVQTAINTAGQEWVSFSTTPVFSNASSFVLSGDQRTTFSIGRRVKTTNSGGTIYGSVSSSAFGTSTTVFIYADSGALDAGLSAVSYGLLSTPNGSVPFTQYTTSGVQNVSTVSIYSSTASIISPTFVSSVAKVGNVSTVGKFGVPTIVANRRLTAQTTSVPVATYNVSSEGSFEATWNARVTASSSYNFQMLLIWTDEAGGNNSQILTYSSNQGTLSTNISTQGGTSPYNGLTFQLRAQSSTAITMSTGGNFGSVTYNVEATIMQIA